MSKNKKGKLDHYDTECFRRLIFATIGKSVELKGLIKQIIYNYYFVNRNPGN